MLEAIDQGTHFPTISEILRASNTARDDRQRRDREPRRASIPANFLKKPPWYIKLQQKRIESGERPGLPLESYAHGEDVLGDCERFGLVSEYQSWVAKPGNDRFAVKGWLAKEEAENTRIRKYGISRDELHHIIETGRWP